jgi:hypothetical protein
MAEGGVDRITAMRVAGHVTEKMWSKYSQVRFDSVRDKLMGAFLPINPQPQGAEETIRRNDPPPAKRMACQRRPTQEAAASGQEGSPVRPVFMGEFQAGINTWFLGVIRQH